MKMRQRTISNQPTYDLDNNCEGKYIYMWDGVSIRQGPEGCGMSFRRWRHEWAILAGGEAVTTRVILG